MDLDHSLDADILCKRLIPRPVPSEAIADVGARIKSPIIGKVARSQSLENLSAGPCIAGAGELAKLDEVEQVLVKDVPQSPLKNEANGMDACYVETDCSARSGPARSDSVLSRESGDGRRTPKKEGSETPREWAARLAQNKKRGLRTRSASPCPSPRSSLSLHGADEQLRMTQAP